MITHNFKLGEIVVIFDRVIKDQDTMIVGDIYKITELSDGDSQYIYGVYGNGLKVKGGCQKPANLRLATVEEILLFDLGITNINHIKEII